MDDDRPFEESRTTKILRGSQKPLAGIKHDQKQADLQFMPVETQRKDFSCS